jgi:hypothetical protein
LARAPQVTSASWTRPRKLSPDERTAAVERALGEPQADTNPAARSGSSDPAKKT